MGDARGPSGGHDRADRRVRGSTAGRNGDPTRRPSAGAAAEFRGAVWAHGRYRVDGTPAAIRVVACASKCGVTRAAMCAEPRAPAIAPTVAEQAVAADEQRIAIELVDTVIRELFGVGLTLQGALPHLSGPAERPVSAAIDGIDRVIRTIRNVVFALVPAHRRSRCPMATRASSRRRRVPAAFDDRPGPLGQPAA